MKRVAVTGIGVITPVGKDVPAFWNALLGGVSGIRAVDSFDTAAFPVHIGAEVRDYRPEDYLRRLNPAGIGRASQFAASAARMAWRDAGLDRVCPELERTGVCLGTTSGEPQFIEQLNDRRRACGTAELSRQYPCHVIPGHVARELELCGPCLMIPTACAAGNFAIGYATDLIRAERADVMLAGGADAFSRITYMGFSRLGAIAPERCQPFDRNRKGMVPGEGAAVLVLEPLERARSRGKTIYAEVLGYGVSCDAHHMTAAHPQGDGAVRAMSEALRDSRRSASDVDYISAHGTGTPTNDRIESLAIRTLFNGRAPEIPMSSIKSMLGHTMGAASAIESAACALALHTGWIPPTINYETVDPDCDLDYVPNQPRQVNPRVILNNAYAFGGNNASVCMARFED